MCARKLGRVKEAAKMFKELTKEHDQRVQWLNSSLGENLIEKGISADKILSYAVVEYEDVDKDAGASITGKCPRKALNLSSACFILWKLILK